MIYGKNAMEHLRKIGMVIYLRLPVEDLQSRLGNLAERGISMREGQTLKELYEERTPYYEAYAHLTLDVEGLEIREVVKLIQEAYSKAKEQA